MKKINLGKTYVFVILALLFSVIFLNFVSAGEIEDCTLDVSLINQDPDPAVPNSYVDVVLQISGMDNVGCYGAKIEVIPIYPFSLDDRYSGVKILNGSTWTSEQNSVWNIPYKIKVDKDALDGESELVVHYSPGYLDNNSYFTKKLNLTIQDSRTNFDAVIQELSGSDVSIAIANTGKYTANSVVVRIPEQDYFTTSVTNGQMVGNLESGDYTIVGFTISAKSPVKTAPEITTQEEFEKYAQNQSIQPLQQEAEDKMLKIDIYYTDNLGERRIAGMELPLNLQTNSTQMASGFNGNMRKQTTSWYSSWIIWVIVLAVLIIAYVSYKKKIFSKLFKKKDSQKRYNSGDKTPDWVKNAKEKK